MKYPDKRIFPRYKMDQALTLDMEGKKVNARLTDLSVNGFGAVAEGPAASSSPVGVRIEALDIHARGEIVWTGNHVCGTRLGIRLTGPLKGDMRNYRPADLLLGIHKMGKTGVLRIVTNLSSKYTYFSKGTVVFATSDNEDRDVCESLLYKGAISPEQFDRAACSRRESGKNRVAALLELGYIRPEDLVPAVRIQAEKVLMSLVALNEGGFIFKEGPIAPEKLLSYTFNLIDLIYRGTKESGDPDKIRDFFTKGEPILCLNSTTDNCMNKIHLDEREKSFVQSLDRERTIQEVLSVSPLDEAETLRMLYALQNVQALDIIETGYSNNMSCEEQGRAMGEKELEAVCRIESCTMNAGPSVIMEFWISGRTPRQRI